MSKNNKPDPSGQPDDWHPPDSFSRLHSHPMFQDVRNGTLGALVRICSWCTAYGTNRIPQRIAKGFGRRVEISGLVASDILDRDGSDYVVSPIWTRLLCQVDNTAPVPMSTKIAVIDRDFTLPLRTPAFPTPVTVGCAYCRKTGTIMYGAGRLTSMDGWQFDHITPRSRGGTNDADNLCLACAPCNGSKGDRTPEEWKRS